ncbi:hypothetical protein [Sutcliffiella rhizosphaerae]|uniref:Uncharacterized protein n=1 Tax=Sutcliffiella rhizosphaerae TaxID=2880967 RepID=A0ABN8ACI7_9BACI|nr:hypothetical protein [Sutcliffiella rhizosphaerae]CAG9622929.1 hypothetical protein BACCIP111883_03724 [Sutcliffiella rhizosphaerae]
MLVSKRYFLTEMERESVEQTLKEKGHLREEVLIMDDDEIIHIYQKYMVNELIANN